MCGSRCKKVPGRCFLANGLSVGGDAIFISLNFSFLFLLSLGNGGGRLISLSSFVPSGLMQEEKMSAEDTGKVCQK